MKDHALKHLEKLTEHHEAMSKVHRDLGEHYDGLVWKGMTADDRYANIAALHKVAQGHHEAMAEHCAKLSEAIMPTVDTSVPTHGDSFGSRDFRASLLDEMEKRWGMRRDAEPLTTRAVGTPDPKTLRPVARPGEALPDELDPVSKAAGPDALSHWFAK